MRFEVRDSEVESTKLALADRMAGDLNDDERFLAAALITPLIVGNSSYSADLSTAAGERAAAAVQDVRVHVEQGQVIARQGDPIGDAELEALEALGLNDGEADLATFAGWFLFAALVVGLLLAWLWRFRPGLWHRNSVLVLVGLLVLGATVALKLTAGRSILTYFLPTAAVGMLLTILLDATIATFVMALIAIVAGAVNGSSLEIAAYVFLGGMAGIVTVRRGDKVQVFVQAGIAVALVNAMVVSVFSLLGERDIRGVLELWLASAAAGAGSAVAAAGSFAVLGSLFGILTVFQLLELANPSQPLLRRLLVETPGTYHHSLMVGNLAERAAEAIGADPLLTRVAAYYHDVGKLANPLAFIENQAGGENVHDQLDPETSAQVLKQHVADGIDIAYKARLPKPLIAFIPQHHGTAIMSYFYGRAKDLAAEPYGGITTGEGLKAAAAVDQRQVPPRRPEAAVPRGGPHHARRRGRGIGPLALVARRTGDPGDGRADPRRTRERQPVRRVRAHPARPPAHPRGVRRPAPRHVPHADRVPGEQGRGARIAAGRERRRRRLGIVTR